MYQAVFYEKRRNKIHIWDDRKGHIVVPYKKYAYVKNSAGFHHTLDGEKVKKVYQWDDDDPNLFESDVPITTRFLVDQYTDSDEPSEGIRTLFFDIEVEVVDGFPDVMKANEKITSIAYYDEMLEKYFCYTLDAKQKLGNYEKDDIITCTDNPFVSSR